MYQVYMKIFHGFQAMLQKLNKDGQTRGWLYPPALYGGVIKRFLIFFSLYKSNSVKGKATLAIVYAVFWFKIRFSCFLIISRLCIKCINQRFSRCLLLILALSPKCIVFIHQCNAKTIIIDWYMKPTVGHWVHSKVYVT